MFSFGRESTARGIKAAETNAALDNVRREELDVALRVRLAFSEALLMRDRVAVRQSALESATEVERVTRERQEAGEVASKYGLVLSFPLNDGGERRAVRAEATAMGAKMTAEYDMARLKIEAEVASAWSTWEAVPAVLDAAKSELVASREAYRITLIRYQEGKAILSELTDARSQLVRAQVGIAESEAYRRQAWTRLARSIGQ